MYKFDELLERAGLLSSSISYRYMNFGGKVVYLAGFKEILQLNSENIIFRLKDKGRISIMGEGLSIKEMDTEIVMVTGLIHTVEVQ